MTIGREIGSFSAYAIERGTTLALAAKTLGAASANDRLVRALYALDLGVPGVYMPAPRRGHYVNISGRVYTLLAGNGRWWEAEAHVMARCSAVIDRALFGNLDANEIRFNSGEVQAWGKLTGSTGRVLVRRWWVGEALLNQHSTERAAAFP